MNGSGDGRPPQGDLVALRRARDRMDREHARPLDVAALARPADQPCGVRDCAVRDPAGNLLRIQARD